MKKWSKIGLTLICVLSLALSLCACAAPSAPAAPQTSAEHETAPQSADGPLQTVYPLTVQIGGVDYTFDAEPQSIVSVSPNMTEILFALGAGDKVIGRTTYCNYPEEALQVETVGDLFNIDIEKILTLSPDLVIGGILFQDDTAQKMNDLGITVASITDAVTLDEIYEDILTVGMVVNRQAEAQACVAAMRERIDAVAQKTAGKDAPTVYYASGFGEYGDFTAGGDTFIHQLITLAGGDNIAKDISGWVIDNEKIFEADPQIILIGTGMKEAFVSDPLYAQLSAVQEGRVYEINDDLTSRQGPRNADAVELLAALFYPEAER